MASGHPKLTTTNKLLGLEKQLSWRYKFRNFFYLPPVKRRFGIKSSFRKSEWHEKERNPEYKWKEQREKEENPRNLGSLNQCVHELTFLKLPWNKRVILLEDFLEKLRTARASMFHWGIKNLPPPGFPANHNLRILIFAFLHWVVKIESVIN